MEKKQKQDQEQEAHLLASLPSLYDQGATLESAPLVLPRAVEGGVRAPAQRHLEDEEEEEQKQEDHLSYGHTLPGQHGLIHDDRS